MIQGEVKRQALLNALCRLGGAPRHRGGEVIVHFAGTTIIVGRRNFSRAMLCRVARKLRQAGIANCQFIDMLK